MSKAADLRAAFGASISAETLSVGKVLLRYDDSESGSSQERLELTIVMPCLNEAETLEICVRKAQQFLAAKQIRGEVLVSDNGSTDGSQAIASACGARVVEVPVRGYGAALIYGSSAARGQYIIMGDADDSYDFSNLLGFLEKLREGYDLVMGNRLRGGIRPGAMPWKNRWIGTPALSAIGRMFFHCPVGDFNCGLRGFSSEAFQKMKLRTTGMEFASEMIVKATLLKMKIAEVPTTLSRDGRSRAPHLRPWRDGWRHLRFMLLCSPRWLFLYPGLSLVLAGLLSCGWLLPGPRSIGRVTLDIHTLFFSAIAVLVGFQALLFAVFSKTFAMTEGLLPPDRKMQRFFRLFHLEVWLGLGALLVLGGLGGALYSVTFWERQGFGALVPSHVMRLAIPSGLSLALGCQVVLSSFFLSLLRMGRRPEYE
jgi:glycosyltransferase involved in cell wall biosynthesis